MIITCVGDDYVNFIYDNIERVAYPFKNYGFNMSFIRFDKNREMYIFRNVFPFKAVINKKELHPGIPTKMANMNNNYRPENLSNDFIWSWINYYESNILFIGSLQENGHIIVDKSIKPLAIIDPKYSYKVPKILREQLKPMHHHLRKEDFRLIKIKDKIFMMDSNINSLSEVIVKDNEIQMSKFNIYGICEIDFNNNTNKNTNKNNKFVKVFEKNWSMYKSYFDDNGLNMLFFHDYDDKGIISIHYNKKTCSQKYLVKFNKDPIPVDDNSDVRFSFGSTIIETSKGVYLGVGHTKFIIKNNSNKKITHIHTSLKKVFKEKYKYHPTRMYCMYFFQYDSNTNKFLISNSFLPIKLCNNYIFSLVFPMSIINKYDKYWISMGYGDYTNLILSFTKDEIDNKLIHDVENFDMNKYDIELLRE